MSRTPKLAPHFKRVILRHQVLLAFTLLLTFFSTTAQKLNKHFEYHIRKTTSPIVIDGKIDEPGWEKADVASSFYMVLPMDTSLAEVPTEVRMTFDEKNLYLSAVCFNKLAGRYYVESLRRDFVFGKNDNFLLFLDPFNDDAVVQWSDLHGMSFPRAPRGPGAVKMSNLALRAGSQTL